MGGVVGIIEKVYEEDVVRFMSNSYDWADEAGRALYEYASDYSDSVGELIVFDSLEMVREIDYATESGVEGGGYGDEGTIKEDYLMKFKIKGETAYLFSRERSFKRGESHD